MPTLFVFLFKVNIALLLFCAGYYLVLRHLTFYSLNRAYLVTAIIFATIYPLIDLTAFAQNHEDIAVPVQMALLKWQAPAIKLVEPLTQPDYWQWITALFWVGVVLLAIRLVIQLMSLMKLYRSSRPAKILDHDVRLMNGRAAPFSFWQSIYVNPANHTPADLKAILQHEQVHVNGWHTLDILLAEISSVFYWFNPGVLLIKKAVRENIEFITDRKILNNGIDSKAYQYSLVNVSFSASPAGIVNHFNISTIKKRIIMMNAKRSSRVNLTRYAFVLPAVALLLVYSFSNAAIVKKGSKAYKDLSHTIGIRLKAVMPEMSHQVALVTTNHSASGKAIADKIAKLGLDNKSKASYLHPVAVIGTGESAAPLTAISLRRDTTHQLSLAIATNALSAPDSLVYIVNGKKISSTEFKKIDANKITTVNIVSAEQAKTLLDDFHIDHLKDNPKILFVTTNDSEEGKRLAAALGKRKQLLSIRVNSDKAGLGDNLTLTQIDSTVAVTPRLGTIHAKSSKSIRTLNEITINPRPVDTVLILNNGAKTAVTTSYSKPENIKTTSGVSLQAMTYSYSIKNKLAEANALNIAGHGNKGIALTNVKGFAHPMAFSVNNIDRISDKLIVIDGKEATEAELKKLSAFNIDRMRTASDADTIKKYGEKARYGVVYIYTKKAK